MAPGVFAAESLAASRPGDNPWPAAASASGNVAPSARVIGSNSRATVAAWAATTGPKAAVGAATSAATISGIRVAAYQAAPLAVTAETNSMAASHTAGCAARRAIRTPAADPIASPLMNAAAIVAKAYVVGPMTSANSRVQATSYTSAAKPEIVAAAQARNGNGSTTGEARGRWDRSERFSRLERSDAPAPADVWGERRRPSQNAPAAATRFNATPTQVVPRRP